MDTIAWLLEGDPVIQRLTKTYLLDEHVPGLEKIQKVRFNTLRALKIIKHFNPEYYHETYINSLKPLEKNTVDSFRRKESYD